MYRVQFLPQCIQGHNQILGRRGKRALGTRIFSPGSAILNTEHWEEFLF